MWRFPGILLALAGLFGLVSCSDRQVLTLPPDDISGLYDYYPLQKGKTSVYEVDSIVYDFGAGSAIIRDSVHFWMKEVVQDTFRDNTGQLLYAIEQYERSSPAESWRLARILAAGRYDKQAVRVEDNFRFLKLVFPFDRRSAWDGNSWIDENYEITVAGERIRPFTNWHYEVDSVDIAAQIGPFAFDSVLVVTEADDNNLIERRFSRVRYAKHVGLVWREQYILDSQYCNQVPPPADCATKPWVDKAEKGYILRQHIVEYW